MTTVTAVPGTGGPPNRARKSPDGSGIPTMPSSRSSKQPTSSAGPKRFFTPRTMRSVECLSPSNDSTTSTRCSSTRGPAIEPSLVTCPTSTTGRPRSLARPGERDGDGAGLGDPAGRAVGLRGGHRLDRVDDEQVGAQLVEVPDDGAEVGLGGEVELVVHGSGALGAQPHLAGRLLAGDVQHASACARPARPPPAAASTCRRRARRPAARPSRGPGRRPSTRSSSDTPVGRARAESSATSPIRRAGAVGAPAATLVRTGAGATGAACSRVPHAWQDGQRPTHCAAWCPHSAQR